MSLNYQKVKHVDGTVSETFIKQISPEMAFIPFDPENRDFKIYLKWIEEGNEPLPADE